MYQYLTLSAEEEQGKAPRPSQAQSTQVLPEDRVRMASETNIPWVQGLIRHGIPDPEYIIQTGAQYFDSGRSQGGFTVYNC